MVLESKKIALISADETDHHVWMQALDNHPDRLELICFEAAPDDLTAFGFVIEPKGEPMRVGRMLDHIEAVILRADKKPVVTHKNYSLTWQDSALTIDGRAIDLTDREREIMYIFIMSGDMGCARDQLLDQVWGYRNDLETHTLETHIYRLRQKIENDPANPERLITIEGGYALV